MSATFCNLWGLVMPRHKLTDKGIRGLETPATRQVDYWDEMLPGFGVRVGTSGAKKSFFVGTRIKGNTGALRFKPPSRIWSLAGRAQSKGRLWPDAQGGIGPEIRKKREEKGTFGAVADAFMQDFAHSHRTRKEMQRKIDVELRAGTSPDHRHHHAH